MHILSSVITQYMMYMMIVVHVQSHISTLSSLEFYYLEVICEYKQCLAPSIHYVFKGHESEIIFPGLYYLEV
jgi:hypothetical protein